MYTTQLFHNQQQLQANTVAALRKAVPGLSDSDVAAMQRAPHRSFDPAVLQVRRLGLRSQVFYGVGSKCACYVVAVQWGLLRN